MAISKTNYFSTRSINKTKIGRYSWGKWRHNDIGQQKRSKEVKNVRIWFLEETKGQSTDFANLRIRLFLLSEEREKRETETKVGTSRQVL